MTESRNGAFIISLDFELHWGVADHKSPDGGNYRENLLGARNAVSEMLALFDECGIHATWATVGKLFFDNQQDLESAYPTLRPSYEIPHLSTYGVPTGLGETSDPLHYGRSLLELIRGQGQQEIASHTFSHFYCEEAGQTVEQFIADMNAAVTAASTMDVELKSLVFPRNQFRQAYLEALRDLGFVSYRGNQRGWMYSSDTSENATNPANRIARLIDSYIPVSGRNWFRWDELSMQSGLVDVPASQFLRPFTPRLRRLEAVRLRRIQRDILSCARAGGVYHLWWHPHNFGINREENLTFLRSILTAYEQANSVYGMSSMTMKEVAGRVMQQ